MGKFDIKQEADLAAEKAEIHDFLRRFAAENTKVQKRLGRLTYLAIVFALLAAVASIWNAVQIQQLSSAVLGRVETPQAPSSAPAPAPSDAQTAATPAAPPAPAPASSPVGQLAPDSSARGASIGTSAIPAPGVGTTDDISEDEPENADSSTASGSAEDAPAVQIHESGEREKDEPGSGTPPIDSTK